MIRVPQVNAAHLPQGGFRRRFMAPKREQILTGRTTGKLSTTLTPMQIHLLRSKIHHAMVTDANVEYEGSLTIDHDLMDKVRILPYERVVCGNLANGNRFETYAIPGKRGTGDVVLNGATAHLGQAGDRLSIMTFGLFDEKTGPTHEPRVIVLGEKNTIKEERNIG